MKPKPANPTATDEEQALAEAIKAARTVQDFLWGKPNGDWGMDEWLRMFRKRVAKLEEIKPGHPHAAVELRKRLLQTAALSIALMGVVSRRGVPWEPSAPTESNLPHYGKPKTGKHQVEVVASGKTKNELLLALQQVIRHIDDGMPAHEKNGKQHSYAFKAAVTA